MNAIVKKTGLLLVVTLLFVGVAAWAEEEKGGLFTWTDSDGVTHLTDSLDKVPPKYRSKTQRVGDSGSSGAVVPESQRPSPPATSGTGADETVLKAQWQSRMLDAKRRLTVAEDRYKQIEQRRNELTSRSGSSGAALPTQEMLDEMNNLDGELARAGIDADKARNEVEVAIPDEARRAGIPPGWLRDVR